MLVAVTKIEIENCEVVRTEIIINLEQITYIMPKTLTSNTTLKNKGFTVKVFACTTYGIVINIEEDPLTFLSFETADQLIKVRDKIDAVKVMKKLVDK